MAFLLLREDRSGLGLFKVRFSSPCALLLYDDFYFLSSVGFWC